jgi:hypothetical protein
MRSDAMNISEEEKLPQNDKDDLDESLIPEAIRADEGIEEGDEGGDEENHRETALPPAMPPGA